MNQTVYIPFSYRLDPGDSEFTIEVVSRFRENPNRLFGFSTVTLCPDYFSRQAYQYDMDSELELKAEVKNNFHLEVEYDRKVFDANAWERSSGITTMGELLKSINTHYQQNKPAGCVFPAVVFDWFDILSVGRNVDQAAYHQSQAETYYGEPYNETKHTKWLPKVFSERTRLNDMIFPTKAEAMENIRIRMTIAPNVTITFSNNALPQALGIADTQMPDKVKNQFPFQNTDTEGFFPIRFLNAPKFDGITTNTKIHAYPTSLFVTSTPGVFKTTVENERKPATSTREYSNALATVAFRLNLEMSLDHIVGEKRFLINFPTSTGIRVYIRVPPYIGHKLGYGHTDNIKYNMTSVPYPSNDVPENMQTRAQVLVYDTGMVVISLDEMGSQQTYQFTNTFMAILEAHESGVLTTKQGVEMPRAPVSQFNKDLRFVLSRFNENNEPIPLGWKDGAYIRGVLVGKV